MSERIRGSYDDALYKSTYTLLRTLFLLLTVMVISAIVKHFLINNFYTYITYK